MRSSRAVPSNSGLGYFGCATPHRSHCRTDSRTRSTAPIDAQTSAKNSEVAIVGRASAEATNAAMRPSADATLELPCIAATATNPRTRIASITTSIAIAIHAMPSDAAVRPKRYREKWLVNLLPQTGHNSAMTAVARGAPRGGAGLARGVCDRLFRHFRDQQAHLERLGFGVAVRPRIDRHRQLLTGRLVGPRTLDCFMSVLVVAGAGLRLGKAGACGPHRPTPGVAAVVPAIGSADSTLPSSDETVRARVDDLEKDAVGPLSHYDAGASRAAMSSKSLPGVV